MLPMFIRESSVVTLREISTALSGMFQLVLMRPTQAEQGTPPSRAKDQSWREAVATSAMAAERRVSITIATRTLAPAREWVVLWKRAMKG